MASPDAPPTHRRGAPLSFGALGVRMGLLGVGVLAVLVALYVRYIRYEPQAAQHVPADAVLALRLDVSQAALYEPFRKHILPLLGDPAGPREQGDTLLHNLEGASNLRRGDLREIVASRGPGQRDWALALAGIFPSGEDEERALSVALNERTPAFEVASDRRTATHRETGVAVGRGPAGAVVVGATGQRLSSARSPTGWATGNGLVTSGACSAVLLRPALLELSVADARLASLASVASLRASCRLAERLEMTLAIEGATQDASGAATRGLLAWLEAAAKAEPGSTFLPSALRRARIEGGAPGETRLHLAWEREELAPALAALADRIRRAFRGNPAHPVLTGP